ncbi:MAG: hypothetical protein NT099_02515 [Candidatus Saganbacteria bacterium]|nr:hypothetical protein [Candidatus Saganbacteria bacterium]
MIALRRLYGCDACARVETAQVIIAARRDAWKNAQAAGQASKADVLRQEFWGKKELAADTADPRILALGGNSFTGGSTSNDAILRLLIEDKTGYVPATRNEGSGLFEPDPSVEVSHADLMRELLPKEALCEFLGIDNLKKFDPLVHGRAAYRFFVMQLTKANVHAAPKGQASVEIMQFGPLTKQDLLELIPRKERQELGMRREFLEQFEPPTVEEMVADGIVLDGGHPQTLIKVASGHIESYRVISELYQLGLAANATIGVPTEKPFKDIHGYTWQQAGEMAIGAQLGAAAIAFYIGRAQDFFEGRYPLRFVGECISLTAREGIISMAASINGRHAAGAAFRIGASVVTVQPTKIEGETLGFLNWALERAQELEPRQQVYTMPERTVVPFKEYEESEGHLETVSSPLLKEGYAKFLKAHVIAAWRVSQFIKQMV